jgi:hypothetical protein
MNNIHPIAQAVQSQGRGKDTQLVHMTPGEVQGLQSLAKAHGGSLSVNPETGLAEAGFLDSLLPTILGAGLAAATGGSSLMIGAGIGGLQYARTGSISKGLMAGLGAYGGAGLATGFMGAGATAGSGLTSGAAGSLGPLPLDQIPAATMGDLAAERAAQQALAQNATTAAGRTAATEAAKNAGTDLALQQAQTAAGNTFGQNMSNFGGGLKGAFSDPTTFMKNYGGSGGDLAKFGGAAAAAPVMNALGPKDSGPAPSDNEQYQYAYNPNKTSLADLEAQRLANPGGELRYFNPTYGPRQTVRVAQGGLLSLAEGGMPDEYTYDPVTQKYIKKPSITAPTGAITPIGIAEDAGGDRAVERSNEQEQFLDWEENSPEGKAHRGERMQALQGLASMGPLGALSNAVAGTKYQTPNFGTLIGTPQTFKDYQQTPEGSARTSEGESYSVGSGAFQDYGGMSQNDLAESGGGVGAAKGGLLSLAAGGMAKGGFVVPADVVSALGNGSTDAGLRALKVKLGSVKPIKGKGDGLSDSIPTSIDGRQPARVADGEAYIDPKTVASIGKGDPKKGAQKLYAMMDKIRSQAHGKTAQQRKVDPRKVV